MYKFLFGIIAAAALLISFAFTDRPVKKGKLKAPVLTTYYYIGDDSYSEQIDETNYIKNPESLPDCPNEGDVVCRIVTSSDEGTNPNFSANRNPVDHPNLFSSVVKKPETP